MLKRKFTAPTSDQAWELMKAFDAVNVPAGFPTLALPYTVQAEDTPLARDTYQVLAESWQEETP